MRRSKTEIYLHLVWGTRQRLPVLTPELWKVLREAVPEEVRDRGCQLLAFDGTEDHAHLLARVPGRVSASELAQRVKGGSSHALNAVLAAGEEFRWQEGYGAFSVSRSHVERVVAYVESQRERHARSDVWPEWEETDEDAGA